MAAPQKTDYELITEALDLSELPIEEQEELLIDIGDVVMKSVLLEFIEVMDDSTNEKFSILLDTDPDEEQVMAFIYEHIPNADLIVQAVITEYANDILAVTKG